MSWFGFLKKDVKKEIALRSKGLFLTEIRWFDGMWMTRDEMLDFILKELEDD